MRHVVRTTDADCDFHGNCKRPACSLQQFLSLNRIVLTTEEKIGGISARHSNLFEKRLPDPPCSIHPSHFARVTVCLSTIRDPSVRPSERDDGDEANTRPSDRCRRSERRRPSAFPSFRRCPHHSWLPRFPLLALFARTVCVRLASSRCARLCHFCPPTFKDGRASNSYRNEHEK